jgi:hypothetical protein
MRLTHVPYGSKSEESTTLFSLQDLPPAGRCERVPRRFHGGVKLAR